MVAEVHPALMSAAELARWAATTHPEMTNEQAASRAISALGEGYVRVVAIEMLADVVAQVRRSEVRVIEKAATSAAVARAATRSEARRERVEAVIAKATGVRLKLSASFLDAMVTIDGQQVRWGSITLAQHRARIERLAVQIAGIEDTVARHQEAIRMIEEAGANTLDEANGRAR